MGRRVGAMFGMVLIVGLALVLVWRVYVHHKQAGGEDDEPSVIAQVMPEFGRKIYAASAVNIWFFNSGIPGTAGASTLGQETQIT